MQRQSSCDTDGLADLVLRPTLPPAFTRQRWTPAPHQHADGSLWVGKEPYDPPAEITALLPAARSNWDGPEAATVREWITVAYAPGSPRFVPYKLKGCLAAFAKLRDAVDATPVITFAHEYGFLDVCPHRTSADRRPLSLPYGDRRACAFCRVDTRMQAEGHGCAECRRVVDPLPLSVWRECASAAASAIRIANRLKDGKPTERQDWEALAWWSDAQKELAREAEKRKRGIPVDEERFQALLRLAQATPLLSGLVEREPWTEDRATQWRHVFASVDGWRARGVTLSFDGWSSDVPDADERYVPMGGFITQVHDLVGIIAVQLGKAVMSPKGWEECGTCGTPIERRAPNASSRRPPLCKEHERQWNAQVTKAWKAARRRNSHDAA